MTFSFPGDDHIRFCAYCPSGDYPNLNACAYLISCQVAKTCHNVHNLYKFTLRYSFCVACCERAHQGISGHEEQHQSCDLRSFFIKCYSGRQW